MSPSRKALRATKKSKKKESLFPKCFCEGPNAKIFETNVPKGLQKGEGISVVSLLGRPWRTFGVRSRFLTQKVKPKSSKNVPKGPKVIPKGSRNHENWLEVVQDSTERFHTKSLQETQARRTARSAYNNFPNTCPTPNPHPSYKNNFQQRCPISSPTNIHIMNFSTHFESPAQSSHSQNNSQIKSTIHRPVPTYKKRVPK